MDALCSLLMIISVLEFFGCKQQKAMLRGGRQESGRFSFGKDTGLFTIATKKSNSAGEAEVPLQGSRQGDNTDTHQGAAVGRNRLCSTQSKSNRAQPGSYALLSARGGHSNLMTVPQRPHTPGGRSCPKKIGVLIIEEGKWMLGC